MTNLPKELTDALDIANGIVVEMYRHCTSCAEGCKAEQVKEIEGRPVPNFKPVIGDECEFGLRLLTNYDKAISHFDSLAEKLNVTSKLPEPTKETGP